MAAYRSLALVFLSSPPSSSIGTLAVDSRSATTEGLQKVCNATSSPRLCLKALTMASPESPTASPRWLAVLAFRYLEKRSSIGAASGGPARDRGHQEPVHALLPSGVQRQHQGLRQVAARAGTGARRCRVRRGEAAAGGTPRGAVQQRDQLPGSLTRSLSSGGSSTTRP